MVHILDRFVLDSSKRNVVSVVLNNNVGGKVNLVKQKK